MVMNLLNLFWGGLMFLIGLWLFCCGRKQSSSKIYQLLVARSRLLWKTKVHLVHQVAGLLIMIDGLFVGIGFWQRF